MRANERREPPSGPIKARLSPTRNALLVADTRLNASLCRLLLLLGTRGTSGTCAGALDGIVPGRGLHFVHRYLPSKEMLCTHTFVWSWHLKIILSVHMTSRI